jgi:DNA-binding NarL/FixJ family response regulator
LATIEVLLVDDQVLFVESLKTVIDTRAEDIHVCGVARTGKEAIESVIRHQPDVILMDVRMPVMDGVEATRIIHASFPDISIMMLTTFDDDAYVVEALNHGAVGYLLKDIPPNELISAVRAMYDGAIIISPQVANKLLRARESAGQGRPGAPAESGLLRFLSRREIEVLRLIGEGYDNGRIARKLGIAEQTVKNHVSIIYSKLNMHDRIQVMRLADNLKDYMPPVSED